MVPFGRARASPAADDDASREVDSDSGSWAVASPLGPRASSRLK